MPAPEVPPTQVFLSSAAMLSLLKRAHEVMASEEGRDLPYEKLLERCVDVSPYRGKVYVHVYIDFHRGWHYEDHWLLSKEDYAKVYKEYHSTGRHFYFGEVNGKHSDVTAKWSECINRIEEDPYRIYELAALSKLNAEGALDATDGLLCEYNDDEEEADEKEEVGEPESVKRPRTEPEAPPIVSPVQPSQECV